MLLYDQLLQFPLFQGMSHDDLEQVAGHTRFGFLKSEDGQRVVSEGEVCNQLFFLLSGMLEVYSVSDDHSYTVTEYMHAPSLLQPEAIFGYNQRFTHTFTSRDETRFITIGKEEVMRLSEEFLVFRINLLNIYATQTQKHLRMPWQCRPQTLEKRIVRFLSSHCLTLSGQKVFHILMTCLADEIGETRINVSHALNHLKRDGLIELHRGRIVVPRMELLLLQ